jgi:hypothetical protein
MGIALIIFAVLTALLIGLHIMRPNQMAAIGALICSVIVVIIVVLGPGKSGLHSSRTPQEVTRSVSGTG